MHHRCLFPTHRVSKRWMGGGETYLEQCLALALPSLLSPFPLPGPLPFPLPLLFLFPFPPSSSLLSLRWLGFFFFACSGPASTVNIFLLRVLEAVGDPARLRPLRVIAMEDWVLAGILGLVDGAMDVNEMSMEGQCTGSVGQHGNGLVTST
jgi:uncharacterized RDD family membrane protein YckC